MTDSPDLSLSIVSHGQGRLIAPLLDDLANRIWQGSLSFEVIVTLNIREGEEWLAGPFPYPLTILRNEQVKGFGANHNAAFRAARGEMFAVVNPDIRLGEFRVQPLVDCLRQGTAGTCGPVVLGPAGTLEDSARRFPTWFRLVRRRIRRETAPDYERGDGAIDVDWIAGMFMLFPSNIFRAIGGFDERYFMYFEDVEICRRLHGRGLDVAWVGTTALIHDAARASRREIRHLRWYLRSLLRFLYRV